MKTQNELAESNDLCNQLIALLPAYTLGTATTQEEQIVKALLPLCPDAANALTDYQVIGDNLISLYPSNEEPPSSAALLQRVRASKRLQPVAQHSTDKPPVQTVPVQPLERPFAPDINHQQPSQVAHSRPSWVWLGLAACFLLAFVGTNIYWASQIDTLRREQQSFLQTFAATQQNTTLTLNASNHHRDLLPSDNTAKNSEASFVWNSTDQIGALVVNGLPLLKQGETYQLWLVKDEQSLSLGTFEVDDKGVGVVIFHSSQPVEQFSHIGVNVEPVGGTAKPTSPHLIIGNI